MKSRSIALIVAGVAVGVAVAPRARAQDEKSIALISSGAATIDTTKKKPVTSFTGDLGFVSASGNTNITTLTVGDKIVHTNGRWMFSQVGRYVSGETDNTTTANQLLLGVRADFAFKPRLSVFVGGSYERNTFAGFNSRTDEIAGLAWEAVAAKGDSARIDLGGVATQEADVDGANQSYPSARAALSYKHQFSKLAYFHQFVEYIPNLQTSGSYRFNTESSLVAPISTHIGVKLAYAIRFDSRPQPTFGTTDRLLTTGIQVSY
ncbi:MAG: YdiY family protein [Gemmatimonadales bacterium]